jgi:hypothetical protein
MNTSQQEAVRDLEQNAYCRLGASRIQGVGIFAIRRIPKGINPFHMALVDDFISVPVEAVMGNPAIDPAVKKAVDDLCSVNDGMIHLPKHGFNSISLWYYVNNSADQPNLGIADDWSAFLALRDIEPGEELTVDYRLYAENLEGLKT